MTQDAPEWPIRLLLVEDSAGFAFLVTEYLDAWLGDRCQVSQVEYLSDAFGLLEEVSFDLVLLDRSLPDSQSSETVWRLRQKVGEMPIVIMSGAPILPNEECPSATNCVFVEKRLLSLETLSQAFHHLLPSVAWPSP